MKANVFFYNIVFLICHITSQWQAYLLSYLQPEKDAHYNFVKDLGLSDL